MPTIKKQTVKKAAVKKPTRNLGKGSVLSRIVPVTSHTPGGMKINVYGRSGTGKTRFACTFPKKALIIGFEDGTRSVSTVKGVDYVPVTSSDEFIEVIENVPKLGYATAILDTATGLQNTILRQILNVKELPAQRSWGMASREQWMQCGAQCKERLRELLRLSDDEGINAVVIAQEREFDDDGVHRDLLVPFVCSALSPSVVGWLNPECDFIVQTFIRNKSVAKKTKVGNKEITTEEKTGKPEFCLRIAPDPVFTVKIRQAPGNETPSVIVDPTYDKFMEYL